MVVHLTLPGNLPLHSKKDTAIPGIENPLGRGVQSNVVLSESNFNTE